jgi:hypothetical protein
MFCGCGTVGTGLLFAEPEFQIDGEIGPAEQVEVDLVGLQYLRRSRDAEHGHARRDGITKLMQEIGMPDQHRATGIPEDVADLLRLEVPVDRHPIGAELHRRIGGLDEGDVVAHQDADAAALADTDLMQSARNARGAARHVRMRAPPLAGDDAEEE